MVDGVGPERPLLPDACVLFNFEVTGRLRDILADLGIPWALARAVQREVEPQDSSFLGPRTTESLAIDVAALANAGLVQVLECASDSEFTRYVELSVPGRNHVDDGEAMVLAIAIERGFAVATDDRKARRVLAELAPRLSVHGTACLLRRWTEATHIEPSEVARMVLAIENRGRYVPPASDPDVGWWHAVRAVPVQVSMGAPMLTPAVPPGAVFEAPGLFDWEEMAG